MVARQPTSWERRGELGFFPAVWQTWKGVMTQPEAFWSSVEPGGRASDAFFFGWLLNAVSAPLQAALLLLNLQLNRMQLDQLAGVRGIPPQFLELMEWMLEHGWAMAIGLMVLGIVFYPLSFVVTAAMVHLGGMLFGAARHGFSATMRVVGYAAAPVALSWIPMVGGLLGLYVFVLLIWGVLRVQETTTARAVGAVLLIPALIFCCGCAAMVVTMSMALASIRGG